MKPNLDKYIIAEGDSSFISVLLQNFISFEVYTSSSSGKSITKLQIKYLNGEKSFSSVTINSLGISSDGLRLISKHLSEKIKKFYTNKDEYLNISQLAKDFIKNHKSIIFLDTAEEVSMEDVSIKVKRMKEMLKKSRK